MAKVSPTPVFAASDSADRASGYSEKLSHLSAVNMGFTANLSNLLFGKFGLAAFFAKNSSTMLERVLLVFSLRSPSEVAKACIKRVAIVMTGFMLSARSWSDKCFQHHHMHGSHLGFPKPTKVYGWISLKSCIRGSNSLSYGAHLSRLGFYDPRRRLDPSKITNFVKFFISNDRTPLFNHFQSPITKAPCEVVRHQHGIPTFGSYPSRTEVLYG